MAACDYPNGIIRLVQLLSDLGKFYDCIPVHVNNECAIKLINNPVFRKSIKYIDVKKNFFRKGLVKIENVSTSNQLADFLTDPLSAKAHVF